jgi:hypothetical protein
MVILATAGQRHEALMLRKLMEAGAVKRTGRGRPRIRPAAVAGDKGYSHLSLRRYLSAAQPRGAYGQPAQGLASGSDPV